VATEGVIGGSLFGSAAPGERMEGHATEHHGGEPREEHHSSIWPFVVALAGGFAFSGLGLFRSEPLYGVVLIALGIAFLVAGIAGWILQDLQGVSFEIRGRFEEPPFAGISRRKLGMWLFIVSEIFFFSGLIAGGLALRAHGEHWPDPSSPEFPLNIPLTAVNTFILITSSLTMVEALHAAQQGKVAQMRAFLAATLALGVFFVSIQLIEYWKLFNEEFLTPWPNLVRPELATFGTAFYAQTGFHGAHVTGGLLGLGYLNAMAWKGRYGKDNHEAIELVGLYWHFVDIVWIFLFPLMYLIGR